MKKCGKCQKEKLLSDFSPQKKRRDGLHFYCKKCRVEWNKNSLIYQEYQQEYQKDYQERVKVKYGLGIGTIQRYGVKIALLVYDRAQRKCEQCGEENDLTIHHLNGKGRHHQEEGRKPDNDIQNLVVWCRKCHGSFHGKQGKGIKHKRKRGDLNGTT